MNELERQMHRQTDGQTDLVPGWMDGWMDGWVGGEAGLRIAYSNQKVNQKKVLKLFKLCELNNVKIISRQPKMVQISKFKMLFFSNKFL